MSMLCLLPLDNKQIIWFIIAQILSHTLLRGAGSGLGHNTGQAQL